MSMQVPPSSERTPGQLEAASTADLVRQAFDEAKELVRTEVELAKEDMRAELKHAERAAVGFGVAAAAAFIVLSLLAVAVVIAFGGTVVAALLVAVVFLVLGGVAAWVGYALLPKEPFGRTRHRVTANVNQLKERIA